ncbi:MAG: helix-hairpin-helix domain-containing protein [Bacillota bacterium]
MDVAGTQDTLVTGPHGLFQILQPVRDAEGRPLTRPGAGQLPVPLLQPVHQASLRAAMEQVLGLPLPRALLRLDHACRNYLRAHGSSHDLPAPQPGPAAIQAEGEDRPAVGYWLLSPGGEEEDHRYDLYSSIYTAGDACTSGAVERIFPHEHAHVVMTSMVGTGEDLRKSTRMHLSTSITDYYTAFYEGWGISHETLALDLTSNHRLRTQERFDPSPLAHWICTVEQAHRAHLVRQNAFIHVTAEPDPSLVADMTSTAFLPGVLKDPQQLLSSEGVAAAFFYRVLTSDRLLAEAPDPGFFQAFLSDPGPLATGCFSPFERLCLKLYHSAGRWLTRPRLDPGRPLLTQLVVGYGRDFPAEKVDLYRLFLETTCCATVSTEAPQLYHNLVWAGRSGDIPRLKTLAGQWRQLFSAALERALATEDLESRVGPELWLTNPGCLVTPALWLSEPTRPHTFNLNAATPADLLAVPGMSPDAARAILEHRRSLGHFTSVAQAAGLPGVPQVLLTMGPGGPGPV